MSRWFLVAFLLCAMNGANGQIYKWIDERGQTCYGDVAPPGVLVERCIVEPPPRPDPYVERRRRNVQRLIAAWEQQRCGISAGVYESIAIAKPKPEEFVRDQGEGIAVTVAVEPEVDASAGHLIQILVDGRPHGQASPDVTRYLPGVERGRHTIAARIVDADGHMILQSSPVEFHYYRETRYHASPFFVGPDVPGISPLVPPPGPARAAPNMPPPIHNYDRGSGPVQGPFRSSGPSVYQAPRPFTTQPSRAVDSSRPPPSPGGGQ